MGQNTGGIPNILKYIFGVLVIGALGLVTWQVVSSRLAQRAHLKREVPQLRSDLVAELESMGFERSLRPAENGAIRFAHSPTMTADDLVLLMQKTMRKYNLVMTAAVKYEERRELYLELSSADLALVGRFLFGPKGAGQALAEGSKGRIGLIIDDFGYIYNRLTDGFMSLETKLTFSIIPGHRFSQILAEEALAAGHEVMVHMPMEPEDYNGRDEEEYILLYGMDPDIVTARIRKAFQHLPQAVGMNNHEGSLASQDTVLLDILATELLDRDKYFVDSFTTPRTRGLEVMQKRGVPSMGRHVFLDNIDEPGYIRNQLNQLARKSERDGAALGIGHVGASHLHTLEVLREELPRLQDEGFEFVFISELMDLPVPGGPIAGMGGR